MRSIALTAAAVALIGIASPAFASGYSSGSASSGSAGGFGSSAGSQQDRQLQRLYRQGRSQVRKHITCKDCEFHRRLNKDTALEVAQNVVNGKFMIAEKDRTAVLYYLRDRYNL